MKKKMKKYLIVILLLISGYSFAQEVPGWIDTTKGTGAAKYQSLGNNRPLPVDVTGPVFRMYDSLYQGTPGDTTWIYDFKGDFSHVEIAWTDTAGSQAAQGTDTLEAYVGIPSTTDTAWSRIGLLDLSDWNIDAQIVNAASTKQYWIKTTRLFLFKLVLANTVIIPTKKGFLYVEAK